MKKEPKMKEIGIVVFLAIAVLIIVTGMLFLNGLTGGAVSKGTLGVPAEDDPGVNESAEESLPETAAPEEEEEVVVAEQEQIEEPVQKAVEPVKEEMIKKEPVKELPVKKTDEKQVLSTADKGIPLGINAGAISSYNIVVTPYNFIDISGTGTPHSLGDDDFAYVGMGFNFFFYNNLYNTLYVISNGLLSFGGSTTAYNNQNLPDTTAPNNIIAPFWDDLDPTQGGMIYTQTVGFSPNRRFIAQWNDVPTYDTNTSGFTFQAIIYESSNTIEFHYKDLVGAVGHDLGESATSGVENSAGTAATQLNYNVANLGNSEGYAFTRNNNAPTHDIPIVYSTSGNDLPTDDIYVVPQSVSDPDSDPVKSVVDWRKGGTSLTVLNMPFEPRGAFDYSTYGNTGTITGTAHLSASGHDGSSAYEFDGVDDVITVPDAASLDITGAITLEAWVNPHTYSPVSDNYGIISKRQDNSVNYMMFLGDYADYNTRLCFAFYNGGWRSYCDDETVPLNTWSHVAATYDGAYVNLYINGNLVHNVYSGYSMLANNYPVRIGASHQTTQRFDGMIDEVKIFNSALSSGQIWENYLNDYRRIDSTQTSIGDVWQACVTPADDLNKGTTLCSATKTIATDGTQCGRVTTNLNLWGSLSSTGSCLNLDKSGLTLNCQGNTITYGSSGYSEGIKSDDSSTIKNCNIVEGGGSNNIGVSSLGNNIIIENNRIIATNTGSMGIDISGSNVFLINNNISTNHYAVYSDGETPSYSVYLIYNNSYGEIRWAGINELEISGSIGHGTNLFIGNNVAALNTAAFGSNPQINSSANITLNGVSSMNQIRRYEGYATDSATVISLGTNCWGSTCSLISHSGGVLKFSTNSFSSFAGHYESPPPPSSSCGDLTSSTTLLNDVSSSGTCFNILNHNVVLDCAGYKINYSTAGILGYAVNNTGFNNVTVKNCNIYEGSTTTSYKHGIYYNSNSAGNVSNNNLTVIGSNSYGIQMDSLNGKITNNRVLTSGNNAYGIFLFDNNITASGNVVNTSGFVGTAIYTYFAENSTIINNLLSTTGTYSRGIFIRSDDVKIRNNQINTVNTGSYGIHNDGSSRLIVEDNTISTLGTDAWGIWFDYIDRDTNNSYLINNDISAALTDEIHDTTGDAYINYLIYNNSDGEIRWTDTSNGGFLKNLTVEGPIGINTNIFIGDNIAALNTSAFTGKINSSANITIKYIGEGEIIPINDVIRINTYNTSVNEILNGGSSCLGTSCSWISYENISGSVSFLKFSTDYFSSFAGTESEGFTCQEINSPGEYTLTSNLQGAPISTSDLSPLITQACVVISTDDVILDCAGHNITHNGSETAAAGIAINGKNGIRKNITIQNCPFIANYKRNIYALNTTSTLVQNVSLYNATESSLMFWKSYNNTITQSTANLSIRYGFEVYDGNNNTLSHLTALNSYGGTSGGYQFNAIYSSSIINCTAYSNTNGNSVKGFDIIYGSENNNITDCTAYGNDYGLDLSGDYNSIKNFTAYNNTKQGVFIAGNSNNLSSVTSYINLLGGLELLDASSNYVHSSSAYSNGEDGVKIWDVGGGESHNRLANIISYNNNFSGFHIENTENNTLDNCTAYNNLLAGLHLDYAHQTKILNNQYYNNSYSLHFNESYGDSYEFNITGTIIDSPVGTFQNYTNLTIVDMVGAGTGYYINWSPQISLPEGKGSFENKLIEIKNITAGVSIDLITWHWNEAELSGYDEGKFELWRYNGSWTMLNDTPDTANNKISLSSHDPSSIYTILESLSSNCGHVNSDLTLTSDVSSPGTCFTINASNIVLDCAGYKINYSTAGEHGYGINNGGGYDNITIKNCILRQDTNIGGSIHSGSIYFVGSSNSSIINNTVTATDNKVSAAWVQNAEMITIENNILNSTNHVLYLTGGSLINITNNMFYTSSQGKSGIRSSSISRVVLRDNKITHTGSNMVSNPGGALYLTSSSYFSLYNNEMNTSQANSLIITGSNITHFNHTIGTDNLAEGLPIVYNFSAADSVIFENTDLTSTYGQLACGWCSNVTYHNITMSNDGISLFNSSNSRITNSKITTTKGFPIYLYGSYNTEISNNTLNVTMGWLVAFYTRYSDKIKVTNNTLFGGSGDICFYMGDGDLSVAEDNKIECAVSYSFFSGENLRISKNQIKGYDGLLLGSTNSIIRDNDISATSRYGIRNYGRGNELINNNISGPTSAIYDLSGDSYINHLIYNNSFGEIRWTDNSSGGFLRNLDLNGPIGHGINLFIGSNVAALNTSAFTAGKINSSANITLYGLGLGSVGQIKRVETYNTSSAEVLAGGTDCIGTSCEIISYGGGTLVFNTTKFSSFAAASSPSSCGHVNSDLTLTSDVSSPGTCFTINASNIVLDCAGYKINYSTAGVIGYGVNNTGFNNVTVKNCNIYEENITTSYKHGIYFSGAADAKIDNNSIVTIGNNSYSLRIGSPNSRITNNRLLASGSNAYGSYLSGNNITMDSNQVATLGFVGTAIQAYLADNSSIYNNTIDTNGTSSRGIFIRSEDARIENNRINTNGTTAYGIHNDGSSRLIMENNTIITKGTNAWGIWLDYIDRDTNNSYLINNDLSALQAEEIYDNTGDSYVNHLIYNNSFGEIIWIDDSNGGFLKNLTLNGSIGLGSNLFIGSNVAALNTSAFTAGKINSTVNVTLIIPAAEAPSQVVEIRKLPGLSFSSADVLENGSRCEHCKIISYTPASLNIDSRVLSSANASFLGEAANDRASDGLAGVGDVNGDGYPDFLIGAPFNDKGGVGDRGQAYLILGKPSGWSMDMNLNNANASFLGEAGSHWAGRTVSGAGDVNGDGYDDFLVSSYVNDEGGIENRGQVYLIFGKPSGWIKDVNLNTANASFLGEAYQDQAGFAASGVGDVNGDGYDDFIIGAPYNDETGTDAGQVYLILGKASGWSMDMNLNNANASFRGEAAGNWAGYAVSGAGDVNGDGYDDFIIGAKFNGQGGNEAGKVYLILGKPSGWSKDVNLNTANATFIGEAAGDNAGKSVAGAGDVNGDGYDDILIGSPYNDEGGSDSRGKAYLIFGKPSGWSKNVNLSSSDASFLGQGWWTYAGSSVDGVKDVNDDGYDDFIIGSHNYGGKGRTYLILGKPSGWSKSVNLVDADATFDGEVSGDNAGMDVAGAGDVNGDGYSDFLIGAQYNDEGSVNNRGQAYLIMGGASSPAILKFNTTEFSSYSGSETEGCGIIYNDTVLANDVSSTGTCFTIGADDITLDCAGYKINYSTAGITGYGVVDNSGYNNITIRNCNVYEGNEANNSKHGFYFYGADNISIINNSITTIGAYSHNVYLYSSSGSIKNNLINNFGSSGVGVRLYLSSGSNITDNSIFANVSEGGIRLHYSDYSAIFNNTINYSGSSGAGIYIDDASHHNLVSRNNITGTRGGILVDGDLSTLSQHNNLTDNIIRIDGGDGIYLFDALGTYVHNNDIISTYSGFLFARGIRLSSKANQSILINNNITAGTHTFLDDTGDSTANYLVYNNSDGEIRWTDTANGGFLKNLTLNGSIGLGSNLFIGSNVAALNTSAFTAGKINSSANITLKGLGFSSVNEIKRVETYNTSSAEVLAGGTDCIGTSCEIISYGGGTLVFNTTKFSSFAAAQSITAPVLISPENDSSATDRTPTFIWNNSQGGASTTYQLQVDDNINFGSPEIEASGIAETENQTNYTSSIDLDVDTTYYWRVRGNDSGSLSDWSEVFNFTVDSYIALTVLRDSVNFGSLNNSQINDTDDNDPLPFLVENAGNVFVNITITGTQLFTQRGFPSSSYQFKIGINESGSFNTGLSTTSWTNVPWSSSAKDVVDLDWQDDNDTFETDLRVEVPAEEGAGSKSSTITFTVS